MYAYRPTILPNRLPAHPGYQQPTGPLARPLPQRAGMPVQGPRPLGAMDAIRGAVRIGGRWGANAVRRGPFQHDGKHSWSPIGVEIAPGSPFDFSDDMGPIDSLMQTPGSRPQQGQASVPSPRYGSGDVVPIGGDVPRVAQSGVVLPENAVGGYGMLSGRRPAYNSSQPLSGGLLRTGPINTAPTAQLPPNQMGYNWDLRQNNLSPLEQRQVSMDRRWQQADPAGPYSNIGGYNRFQSLPSSPAPSMTPPPMGPFGRSRLVDVDGRQVGFGPNASVGDYANTPEGQAGARGVNGVYVDTMGTPNAANQAYAARAADRAAGLREGRRNRAIAKHGLTWLQPTNNYAYDSRIGGVGGYTRQSPLAMPPSMQSDGGEEAQVASRVQQVQDFSRANPNATLADYERAGFTREDVELAHASGSTPHLMDQATQDPFLAGMLGSMLGPLTAVGVGPLAPVAQERRRQRQQGNARIGTILGRPSAPQQGGGPSAFGRGVISALWPW